MICEHCYGKGVRGSVEWSDARRCPECQGPGIVSCCDTAGAYMQPEEYWAAMQHAIVENWVDPKIYEILGSKK